MSRARQFDEEQVLDAAKNVFWEKGYEATSTRDLTAAMGLTNASLYNAFGDKRSLYLATLDHYLNNSLRERMARLSASLPPDEAISEFFAETIRRAFDENRQRGCLLVNTALEVHRDDPEMRAVVAKETELIEAFFLNAATEAQKQGKMTSSQSPAEISRLLLATALGLRVLERVRPDLEILADAVRPVLSMLQLPAMKSSKP